MNVNFLDFERPIADLEAKIEELAPCRQRPGCQHRRGDRSRLRSKSEALTRSIFGKLTPWQIARSSRGTRRRPYTLDYLSRAFTEFTELHGDRHFADDGAIVGGVARLDGHPVVVVGHQKGRTTKENIDRSFGMPRPEGYRKALRLFEMAERFRMPVISFIDTPGAYPGVGAEERGQSEAIARNLHVLSTLDVPILCTVIGEGGFWRRTGHRGCRLRGDAAVQHLLRDLSRGLRLDPVEERRKGGGCRAGDGHHVRPAPGAGADRPNRERAARWSAP